MGGLSRIFGTNIWKNFRKREVAKTEPSNSKSAKDLGVYFPSEAYLAHIAYVDIVDACNLRCPECIRGSGAMRNTTETMDLGLFSQLCEKFKKDKIERVDLFNWTEPFLNREIDKFIEIVKCYQFKCGISSNLSLSHIDTLEKCFAAGLDYLYVSVSGFTDKIQNIYHRNSNIETIKRNLEKIARNKEYAAKTTIKFLRFSYNNESSEPLSRYAKELGMNFMDVSASGDPENKRQVHKYDTTIPPQVSGVYNPYYS